MNKKNNILVIGMGNHAQRIYLPTLIRMSENSSLGLYGVDTLTAASKIKKSLRDKGLEFKTFFLDNLSTKLSQKNALILKNIVSDNNINAVIISTPPDSHKTYAKWALKNGLHILMDKPITARKDSSTKISQAKKLVTDYEELVTDYKKACRKNEIVFMVNTQRRYEAGYQYAFKLIKEATDRFNIPITSIQSMHADGVWIFPDEIVSQQCHHYYDGYGKCSHSGFHLFDIIWQLYKAGYVKEKFADTAEVYSSFIEPRGTLKQLSQSDYVKLFGSKYNQKKRRSNKQLVDIFQGYGENDAFSIIRLLNKNDNVCNLSINLMHNSTSERNWLEPKKDLYKGNGRIKHQYYYIQQGPFQSIQIHNYQSKSKQDQNKTSDYEVGGNNHFDVYVFRNPKMFGNKTKNFTKLSLKDLDRPEMFDDSRLYHETTKELIIKEFINTISGRTDKRQIKSKITTYQIPVQIMSAVYQSNCRYKQKINPLVKFKINEKE